MTLALSAYVFMQTGSAFKGSLVFAFTFLPPIFVGAAAGGYIDRHFSKWLLIKSELLSLAASAICGLIVYLKYPVALLALVLAMRSVLSFVSKSAYGRWIKLITTPELQTLRFKFFSFAYFLAYAVSGLLSAVVLAHGNIITVTFIDCLTYLAGTIIVFMIPAYTGTEGASQTPTANPTRHSIMTTLFEFYRIPAVRGAFIIYCITSTLFQGSHQALISFLPIKVFTNGAHYIGYLQLTYGLGIMAGFFINWAFPQALRAKSDEHLSNRMIFLLLLNFAFFIPMIITRDINYVLVSSFLAALTMEWNWLDSMSEFFRSSPKHAVARYQFTATSIGCFLMSLDNVVVASLMDRYGVISGFLITFSLISALLLLLDFSLRAATLSKPLMTKASS
jgi:hypothetical protein